MRIITFLPGHLLNNRQEDLLLDGTSGRRYALMRNTEEALPICFCFSTFYSQNLLLIDILFVKIFFYI